MGQQCARRFGALGRWCALGALGALGITVSRPLRAESTPPPLEPERALRVLDLPARADSLGVVVYPARVSGPRPVVVVLHGMCGEPLRTCSHFAEEVTRTSHLICPRASQRCSGGGASWPASGFANGIEAAVTQAIAALPEAPDVAHGRTLIGYSLGAYRALEIAQNARGIYPRVMLIGAKVSPNRALLAENGVSRLLLCAGRWDMMHDHMLKETERAQQAGVRARFLDLGPVGHAFTELFSPYLDDALSWLGAE